MSFILLKDNYQKGEYLCIFEIENDLKSMDNPL